MKIYEFSSFFTPNALYTVTAIEVEEKPKSYVGDGIQITKDKINVLQPQFGNRMFRLDDDPKEYIEAVVKYHAEKIEEYTARLKKATDDFCDWYKLLQEETGDKNERYK